MMQKSVGQMSRLIAIGAVLTIAGGATAGAQGTARPETSLLGVTLLKSSFRDVLKRYGRPDEIQVGGPYKPSGGPGGASPTGGMASGGRRGANQNGFMGGGGTGAAGPMGGRPGMAGSFPGMGGGLPGFGGSSGGPGMGGQVPGMPPMGRGSMRGMGGMGSGGQAMGGMGSGAQGMPGYAGPGGATGGSAQSADTNEYEATWWYNDPINGLHKSFLFNKDGRVIQIQQYGHDKNHKSSKTRLGVMLGSSLNQVLHTYGWSNEGTNAGSNMVMRFGGENRVAFQLVNNIVVGITIAIVKDNTPVEDVQ